MVLIGLTLDKGISSGFDWVELGERISYSGLAGCTMYIHLVRTLLQGFDWLDTW